MTSTTKIVGAGANVARAGSIEEWLNPGRITADDASDATAGDIQNGGHTDYLEGTMTGNLFAIPSDHVIQGVEIAFEHSVNTTSDGTQLVDSIRLVSSLGNGTDKGDSADITTTSPTLRTYGGSTDLHGLELTPAVVNDGSFGFELSIVEGTGSGNGKQAKVDFFRITVHHAQVLIAEKGTVSITGKAASFKFPVMGAKKGSVSITGKAASMRYVHRMVAEKGSVSVTGKNATMESTQDWLEKEKAKRVILVELTETDDTVHYLSQGGYTSHSTDTPASQYYKNIIDGDVVVGSRMSGPFNLRGGSNNLADIIIANDGDYDGWALKDWKSVKVKHGDKAWALARFKTHWQGSVLEVEETDNQIRIALRDRYEELQRPAQFPEQIEGPEWGTRLPLCYGYPKNVTPLVEQLVNNARFVVHEGNVPEDVAVTRYINQAASTSPAITKGTGPPNIPYHKFELAGDPAGVVTVDVKGVRNSGGTWIESPGAALKDMLTRSINYHMGTVVAGDVSGGTLTLDSRGSDTDDHYLGAGNELVTGVPGDAAATGSNKLLTLTDYDGTTKVATGTWETDPATDPRAGDLWRTNYDEFTMQAGPWTSDDIVGASFDTLDTDWGSPRIGLWVDDDASCAEVLDRVLSPGGWHAINGTRLEVGLLIDPDGESPDMTLTDRHTLGDMAILAVQQPAWKVRVGCDKNHTVQRGSAAGAIDMDRLGYIQKEYRWTQRMDESIHDDNFRAVARDVPTVLTEASDGETEADRLWALFKVARYVYTVATTAKGIGARVGQIVSMSDDRHELASGHEFVVVGKTENLTRGVAELELWR